MKLQYMKGIDIKGGLLPQRFLSRGREEEKAIGKIRVLSPKALTDGMILESEIGEEEMVREMSPLAKESLTRKGDLLLKLSAPYDTAIVEEGNEGLFVSHFFALIRAEEDVRAYLMAFLNSESFLSQVRDEAGGSFTHLLRISSIRDLDIPEKSKEEMKRIGERYATALRIRQKAMEIWKWEERRNSLEFMEEN